MSNIEDNIKLDYCDVLIRPKRSALVSRDIPISRTFRTRWNKGEWHAGIPLIASNMDHTGTIDIARVLSTLNCHTALDKHFQLSEVARLIKQDPLVASRTWLTLGMDTDISQIKNKLNKFKILTTGEDFPLLICLDVANGYQESFASFIKEIRDKLSPCRIMAGNVATPEMTEHLILSGADIVKIGIGPGSCCITRKIAGVGFPQLSAILECVDAAHGLDCLICADGGCTCPGDVAKAFGAGADFVMLGGMLAGHDECTGDIKVSEDGLSTYKEFYGMSSKEALNKYAGGAKDYRAAEGKLVTVPYRGPVEHTIQDILGGVRSAMTYVGARRLKDLSKCTTFVRVNRQLNNIFGG